MAKEYTSQMRMKKTYEKENHFLSQTFLNDKKKSQNELEANAQPNLRFN